MIDYRSEDVKIADVVDFKSNPDNSMKKNMETEKAVKGFVGQKGAHTKSPDSSGGNWKLVKEEKVKENNGGRNLGMMKKRKQKWAQIDGAMEGDNLKKAMERRKKALDRHDKKMQQEIQRLREVSPKETSVAVPSLSQKESIATRMARGSFDQQENQGVRQQA